MATRKNKGIAPRSHSLSKEEGRRVKQLLIEEEYRLDPTFTGEFPPHEDTMAWLDKMRSQARAEVERRRHGVS